MAGAGAPEGVRHILMLVIFHWDELVDVCALTSEMWEKSKPIARSIANVEPASLIMSGSFTSRSQTNDLWTTIFNMTCGGRNQAKESFPTLMSGRRGIMYTGNS